MKNNVKYKSEKMENFKIGEVGLYYIKNKENVTSKITCSTDAYKALKNIYDKYTVDHKESFYVLALNNSNYILDYYKVSDGGITGTVVDIRNVFQFLLLNNAVGFIVSHNHPSGTLKPSRQDLKITDELKEAGKMMKINLLDHIIYTSESYCSLADEGNI